MDEIKIEKGVPIGMIKRKFTPSKYPFHEMEIGDSFVVKVKKSIIATSAYYYGKSHGKKFTCRQQADGSFRVWRIS